MSRRELSIRLGHTCNYLAAAALARRRRLAPAQAQSSTPALWRRGGAGPIAIRLVAAAAGPDVANPAASERHPFVPSPPPAAVGVVAVATANDDRATAVAGLAAARTVLMTTGRR